jgi:hypothetical protein
VAGDDNVGEEFGELEGEMSVLYPVELYPVFNLDVEGDFVYDC